MSVAPQGPRAEDPLRVAETAVGLKHECLAPEEARDDDDDVPQYFNECPYAQTKISKCFYSGIVRAGSQFGRTQRADNVRGWLPWIVEACALRDSSQLLPKSRLHMLGVSCKHGFV